jgi:hypothetical protein
MTPSLLAMASLILTTGLPRQTSLAAASVSGANSNATPGSASSLRVTVDPRIELLSLLFKLAGNPEYCQGRVQSYTEDVEKQFAHFSEHAAVELARELRSTRGVSYDACMSMAVHLSDAYQPRLVVPLEPWPEGMDKRWRLQGVCRAPPTAL